MSQPPAPSRLRAGLGLIGLILAGLAYALLSGPTPPPPTATATATTTRSPAPTALAPRRTAADADAITTVDGTRLADPDEVREIRRTLAVMRRGPPYPFRADDEVWENRERRLPSHPRGWYHAFTVVTPGEHDRGARRIVAGDDGALWFTRDHYFTFDRLALPDPRQALRN